MKGRTGWRTAIFLVITTAVVCLGLTCEGSTHSVTEPTWYFQGVVSSDASVKMKHVTVVHDPDGIVGIPGEPKFMMWWGTSSPNQLYAQTSNDGLNWTALGQLSVSFPSTVVPVYHPEVTYDRLGFSQKKSAGAVHFKMWFYDGKYECPASYNWMRYAESGDGVNWQIFEDSPHTASGRKNYLEFSGGSGNEVSVLYKRGGTGIIVNSTDQEYVGYQATSVVGVSSDGAWFATASGQGGGPTDVCREMVIAADADVSLNGVEYRAWDDLSGVTSWGSSTGLSWNSVDTGNPPIVGAVWSDFYGAMSVVVVGDRYYMYDTMDSDRYSVGLLIAPIGPPIEVWVDDDYCDGCGNDGHTWGYDAFDNIQDGVDAVVGSTVYVAAGTYTENLTVDRSITVRGAGAGSTIVDGSGSGNVFTITADEVVLHDMTLQNGDNGVYASDVSGLQCQNLEVSLGPGVNSVGINFAQNVSNSAVQGGSIYQLGGITHTDGIRLERGSNNNVIDGIEIYDTHHAIKVHDTYPSVTTVDNVIQDCNIHSNDDAIFLWNGAQSNEVLGNNIHNNEEVGIKVNMSQDNVIEGNTFNSNGSGATGSARFGIWMLNWSDLDDISGNMIRNNTFINNTGGGIAMSDERGHTRVFGNMIEGNTFQSNGGPDISSQAGVHDNTVFSNSFDTGIENTGTSTVNASGNWWGTNTPAGVAAEVSANVDYTPWLGSGTDTDPTTSGFQGDFSTLWVDDDSPQTGATGRIQEGVDLASSSTVNVAAGTYNERLNIDKQVTLQGAQYGVDPTPPGARTSSAAESIITEAGLSTPNPDVLIEIPNGVTGVTIDGFTLIGDPTNPVADTSTIRCWDDDITISNNIISGKYNVLFKGADRLTVSKNRMVTNKVGVTVQPDLASDLLISDNTFALGSSPAGGESAIYTTSVKDSTVSGNTASGFLSGGGLKGSNNNNIIVSGNSFTGNKDGFSFWGTTTSITVKDNDLSSNTRYGINIKGQDITITGNEIANNGDTGINIDRDAIDTERVTISNNDISGNANYGLEVNTAKVTEIIDAENNWWGSVDGPEDTDSGTNEVTPGNCGSCSVAQMLNAVAEISGSLGNKVSDNVDYCLWLPYVEFAQFTIDHAKIDFKKKADDDKVRVKGRLALDLDNGDGVLISEDVTITVGPLTQTIPVPMLEKGRKGDKWEYKRPKDGEGIIKHMTIDWKNGKFDIRIDDADLTGVSNPEFISIQIGDDVGSESILMREHKHHWDYKAKHGPKAVEIEPLAIADELKVVAYPNPIRDVHTATFQVMGTLAAEVEEIRVQIYDLSGRLVWEDAALGPELDWHTDSLSGDYLANGMYLYKVQVRIDGNWINQDIGRIAVLR